MNHVGATHPSEDTFKIIKSRALVNQRARKDKVRYLL